MPPVVAGIAVVASLNACAGHSSHPASWHACPRPASAADIRRFKVAGGAACLKFLKRYPRYGSSYYDLFEIQHAN